MKAKLSLLLAGLLVSGCTIRSDNENAATAKLLADAEQVAIHEVPAGPTQRALCVAFETASQQLGQPLHPTGSPVPPPTK